jgi:CheY-like chemotaxis protein
MCEIKINNVLLAEDDEDDVHLFKTVLAELNQDILVTVTTDGNLLMAFLNQASTLPEMIFLDLNMPYKNGFECLSEIRGNEKWNSIKIFVLSTSTQPQHIEDSYKGGADLYLAKPTSYTQFKNMIEKCLVNNWEGLKHTIH